MATQKLVDKEISPEEARIVSQRLREYASTIQEIKAEMRNIERDLDSSWRGVAKNHYSDLHEHAIRQLGQLISDIKFKASEIAAIRIIIQVVEWVDDIL